MIILTTTVVCQECTEVTSYLYNKLICIEEKSKYKIKLKQFEKLYKINNRYQLRLFSTLTFKL